MSAALAGPAATFVEELKPLLDLDYRVVPIRPGARTPMRQHWPFGREGRERRSSSTSRLDDIVKVVSDDFVPLIGVPTGQPHWETLSGCHYQQVFLNVLDVDAESGGLESFDCLTEQLGLPPLTARVKTKTPGCFHLWLHSPVQWGSELPAALFPGLEYKRALQYVVAPPSTGYAWLEAPWEIGVVQWPELDSYVSMVAAGLPVDEQQLVVPRIETWRSVDDYLLAISSAKAGSRSETLLRFGGKIAYATATGTGLGSPAAVAAALWRACATNGLLLDHPEEELERKIRVYERWSDPASNPLLSPSGRGSSASRVIGRFPIEGLSGAKLAVFEDLGTMARAENHEYAKRFGARRLGYSDSTIGAALKWLRTHGLIEQGPSLWNEGSRASHTYKLTALGNVVLKELG